MAGANYMVKTSITFDTKSAQKELEKLQQTLEILRKKENEAADKANAAYKRGNDEDYKKFKKEADNYTKLFKQQKKMVDLADESVNRIRRAMENMSGMTLAELKNSVKVTQDALKQIRLSGEKQNTEFADELARHLRNLKNEISNIEAGFSDLENQMKNYTGYSIDALERLQQRLIANRNAMSETAEGAFDEGKYKRIGQAIQGVSEQVARLKGLGRVMADVTTATPEKLQEALKFYKEMVASGELNNKQLKQASSNISLLNKELANRSLNVLENAGQFSQKEILEATKFLREYGSEISMNSTRQIQFNNAIAKGEVELKKYSEEQKKSAMTAQLKDVSRLTDDALSGQVKFWNTVLSGLDSSDKKYKKYVDNLKIAEKEQQKRLQQEEAIAEAELRQKRANAEGTLTTGLKESSVTDIKEAIKVIEVLRDEQVKGGAEWTKYADMVDNATKHLKFFDELRKQYADDEELAARRRSAETTLTDKLTASSISQTKEAIKVAEQLRDEQVKGSEEWRKYSEMIDRANEHLKKFDEDVKKAKEASELSRQRSEAEWALTHGLPVESVEKIKDAIKTITKLRDEQALGTESWKYYSQMIEHATNHLKSFDEAAKKAKADADLRDKRAGAETTLTSGLTTSSVKEVKAAIKVIQDLREEQEAGSEAWKKYGKMVQEAQSYLKFFEDDAKDDMMRQKWTELTSLSAKALEEQKKYWKEMVEGAAEGSNELEHYKELLDAVNKEEQSRAKAKGNSLLTNIQSGGFSGTIRDTKKAIEELKKYRELLDTETEAALISSTNKAITELELNLKAAEAGFVDMNNVIKLSEDVASGKFDGSIKDVKTLKKLMEEYKQSLLSTGAGAAKIEEIDRKIKGLSQDVKEATMTEERFNQVLGNPKTASYKELKEAASKLKKELQDVTIRQGEYNDKCKQLQEVDREIKSIENSWKGHKSAIQNAVDRLKTYVLVYVGFQEAVSKFQDFFRSNIELSDQMTNVQKVTNMTNSEIRHLVDNLQELDTRTSTTDLMQFAEQAGKLGVYSEQGAAGMQQFVEMAERINSTLGEDIGGAQAVADLAKVNDILGETERIARDTGRSTTAMRDALNATGSAILNVGNNSAASYAAIVNYVGRLGAVGSTSKMTMQELIALGGTLDALKMNAEAGSTALSQFISSVSNHTYEMAKAAKLDLNEFRNLVSTDMFKALNLLVSRVKEGKVSAQELMNAMTGRSRTNVNIRNVITLLANNTDMLNQQLAIANEGYKSAIENGGQASIMAQEFARVNENAAGSLERISNRIREIFVNSGMVEFFTGIIRNLADFIDWLDKGSTAAITLKSAVAGLTAALIVTRMHLQKMVSEALLAASAAFTNLRARIVAATTGVSLMTAATNLLKGAWVGLGRVMKANWLAIVAGIVMSVVTAIKSAAEKTKAFAKATAEANEQLYEETRQAALLFSQLNKLNQTEEERASIIGKINNKYSTLLGYMISEKAAVSELSTAYSLLIAKMNERINMQVKEKMIDKINEESAEKTTSAIEHIAQATQELYKKFGSRAGEMAGKLQAEIADAVNRAIMENPDLPVDKIFSIVEKEFDARQAKKSKKGVSVIHNKQLAEGIKEYIQASIDRREKEQYIENMSAGAESATSKMADKAYARRAYEVNKKMKDFLAKFNADRSKVSESELKDVITSVQSIMNDEGFKNAAKNNDNLGRVMKAMSSWLPKFQQEMDSRNPWGNNDGQYDNMTSEEISALIDLLEKTAGSINRNQDYEKTFEPEIIARYGIKNGMSNEYVRKKLFEEATKLKKINEERDMNRHSKYRWDESGSRKKDMDDSEGALASLERYYEERQTIIEDALARQEITEEEAARRSEEIEYEHLEKRAELRKYYTHKQTPGAFGFTDDDAKDFRKWWDENLEAEKYGLINWNAILSEWANTTKDKIRENNLKVQKDFNSQQKLIVKHNEEIKKALLDGDSVGKVLDDFVKMTDTLGIFFKNTTTFTQEEVNKRLDILRGYSAKVNSMTIEEFSAEIHAQKEFSSLSEDETKVMYEKLLQLREDYDSAVRKQAQKDIKLGDNRYRNGTWYKEQLDIYNSYLNRLTEAGQTETDIYRNVVDTISYLRKRQNRDGKSWVEEQEKQLASLEKNLEREKKVGASGVSNDTNIAKAEIAIVEHQMNMELDKLTYRRSLYAGQIKAIENTKAQLEEDLKTLNSSSAEYITKKRMLDVVSADLLAKQVARDEAVKESEKSVLDLQKEVTEKQADLLAKRMNDVQEWMSIFTDTINSIGKAGASAAESKRFEIMQKNQEELINGAAYVGSTYLETASDGMLKAVKRYTEKTTYLIMKASGDIKTVSLSAVEAMQEEIRIAASNERIEAFNNMFQAFGEKLSKAVTDKFTRDAELEEQKNFEQQRQQVIQDAQLASLNIQLAAEQNYTLQYQQELAKRFDMQADYYRKSQQIQQNAHSGTGNVSVGIQGPGVSLTGDTTKAIVESWGKAGKAMVDVTNKTTDAVVNSDKQKVKSAETSTASMIQSANLYSAAYNTLTNDALNSTQKAQMFIIQTVGQTLMTILSATLQRAIATGGVNLGEAISKVFADLGVGGFLAVGGITAAIGAAMAMATNAAKKGMQQISAITNTGSGSGSSRRLVTGMLTYAEGNYPVLGNDGKVYNAKYEKKLSTGIYSGPRFGIFSEKRPEAVIDGETTQKLLLDYPAIWKSILTISKNGRLVNGGGGAMATHAAGTLEEVTRAYTQANPQLQAMPQQDNSELTATLQALIQVLTSGEIKTSIDMYGQGGLRNQSQRAERFAQRRRIP